MKKAVAIITAIALVGIAVVLWVFRSDTQVPDLVFINEALQSAIQSNSINESVNALSNQFIRAFEDMDAARHNRDIAMQIILCIGICVFASTAILLCLYCERNFIMPFRKLQSFAHRIAAGNLDTPLEMDKRNLFGAFTESFDIMREELRTAKENEYKANQQKKELVTSLSHDIKTPIASIMSAMDIMLVKAKDEKERKAVESVNAKLEQINALVTNMFQATLEELQALKVMQCEIQSTEIHPLIQNADYQNKITSFELPDCIVLSDPLRLQQVFDNIIHNSYKYANSDIFVTSRIDGSYLIIDVQDYGTGVPDEEIPLLTSKFYRGTNAGKADGYGLGLYISKYFMEQMSGDLCCANRSSGFTVMMKLRLT